MKQERRQSHAVLALLLLLAALLLMRYAGLGDGPPKVVKPEQIVHETDVEPALNAHLHETNSALEKQKLHRDLENGFASPQIGKLVPIPQAPRVPLPLDPVDQSDSITGADQAPTSPETIIESELADKQQQQRFIQEYRQEIIREYIETARRHGMRVEVDAAGVVRRVMPLSEPSGNPTADASQ